MSQSYLDVQSWLKSFHSQQPYEWETAFSTLLKAKTKSRSRLEVTFDMRVALSKTQPKIELVEDKQVHPSHCTYYLYAGKDRKQLFVLLFISNFIENRKLSKKL